MVGKREGGWWGGSKRFRQIRRRRGMKVRNEMEKVSVRARKEKKRGGKCVGRGKWVKGSTETK